MKVTTWISLNPFPYSGPPCALPVHFQDAVMSNVFKVVMPSEYTMHDRNYILVLGCLSSDAEEEGYSDFPFSSCSHSVSWLHDVG